MDTTWLFCGCLILVESFVSSQKLDRARGPWQIAFQVYNGDLYTWNSSVIGHDTMWGLFTSVSSYNPSDPSSYEPYKSNILQDWEDKKISVQAVKLAFTKGGEEKAFVVFNGFGKTKSTWFTCDNILYSSFNDLPNAAIAKKVNCPGTTLSGFPLSIQNKTFTDGPCPETTGWTVVADRDLTWSVCSQYAPYEGLEPYFKYSKFSRIANLSTELEVADSLEIYIQVWDMVFKGVDGIKSANPLIKNLTDLWLSVSVEYENDPSALTLTYSPVKMYKSGLVNNWGAYYIETVKYSMFDAGIEKAFFVFDGRGSDLVSWFAEENILYTNFNIEGHAPFDICSIDGDTSRHWQIQKVADTTGCTDTEQLGWMLIKEPKNNGTCPWDMKQGKIKPYFLYNTQPGPSNPENFEVADVMAVFVHGWRLVLKVSANGSVLPESSVYALWNENGTLNENNEEAKTVESGSLSYKSSVVDMWDALTVRAVKIAAYKNGVEEFYIVFDAVRKTRTSWFDCSRVLYTSVNGLDRNSLTSYTCRIQDSVSSLSFLIGKNPTCGPLSAVGVFGIIDASNQCSARTDKPQFIFSTDYDATIADVPSDDAQLADTFAIFLDMANCWDGLCKNGATCDDRGGYFYCFCSGLYYGETCVDLDGTYEEWTAWTECNETCGGGVSSRSRECVGVEGYGQCHGPSEESVDCNTNPCPVDGGFSDWTNWSNCSEQCGTGARNRSRDCTNPEPQYGGIDCIGERSQEELCNTHICPIDGGWSDWSNWTECTVTCSGGVRSRTRECNKPSPQYGGQYCMGNSSDTEACNTEVCPPVQGGWSKWTAWTGCPVTCGKERDKHSRSRMCDNPVPEWGGDYCIGSSDETEYCNNFYCPIDGGWGNWTSWSACTDLDNSDCGKGLTTRSRVCDNPPAQYGGEPCVGNTTEIQICTEPCATIQCDADNPSECEMIFRNSGSTTRYKNIHWIVMFCSIIIILV